MIFFFCLINVILANNFDAAYQTTKSCDPLGKIVGIVNVITGNITLNETDLIVEASNNFEVKDVNKNEFSIEIRGEIKFKNIWIIKLNQLKTNLEEIDFYKDS